MTAETFGAKTGMSCCALGLSENFIGAISRFSAEHSQPEAAFSTDKLIFMLFIGQCIFIFSQQSCVFAVGLKHAQSGAANEDTANDKAIKMLAANLFSREIFICDNANDFVC
jgi:hypothetical protein